ncbi:unnamed protein product [Brassicogethes aeneus]|uniref:Endoplasmic reticulum lectin 1 n=1 Tax=Brassicogethes aeneus TaxID=1431903 RepID=A0A9P0B073_BRAAE|nr:unnamed protein product [Brassicogethes aeneus]
MDKFTVVSVLCSALIANAQQDVKGFDDTVLFDIFWPGNNVDEELGKNEEIIVTSAHQEKYRCILPSIQEKESQADEKYDGPTALDLISPLFTQSTCSYRFETYWTYEVCHGRFIRQYHEDREGKKVKLQEYKLGQWEEKTYDRILEKVKAEEQDKSHQIPLKKIDNINLPYLEVSMENGTLCDLNYNKPRSTKVLYVCYVHGKNEVYSLKETSTCQYEIIILSPFLCSHPKYKPKETGENKINCMPLEGAPDKPYSLMKMKIDSLKLRRNSDFDRIKVEIIDIKDSIKPPAKKPNLDPSPVKSFLTGKNCLNGGTGWWKYEFCYGKSVEQYHVDKDFKKTAIKLGRFNKETHLDWIKTHPQKRPKPKGERKQLSHFYSDGDVCDKTGKPRQTEVKLKCLENTSPSAVSLYLLEPRYCEYILGVESPLICDILAAADENGLVEDNMVDILDGGETVSETTVNIRL